MDKDTLEVIREVKEESGLIVLGGYKKEYSRRIIYTIFLKDDDDNDKILLKKRFYPKNILFEKGKFKHGAKAIIRLSYGKNELPFKYDNSLSNLDFENDNLV